jgi:hypothetical protein
MTADGVAADQAPEHRGALHKQLHLRSLVLFGLAYMTPIIVLGIFGVIAERSDGGSAGSYLLAKLDSKALVLGLSWLAIASSTCWR